jgi:branched-chain amino acid transport system substrate-binding protein
MGIRVSAGFALAALALAGCGSSGGDSGAEGSSPVTVAAMYPLSGAVASQGLDTLHGAQLAAELVNGDHPTIDLPLAAGKGLPGLQGRTVDLLSVDTQGDPQKGASDADQAVTGKGAVALLGAYQSAVTKAASQRAERLAVPFVNGESSSTELTERGLKWFFRTGPSDNTFAQGFFDFLDKMKQTGKPIKTIGIFHGNEDFGNGGAKITTQLAESRGYQVVADVSYDVSAADLTSQVQQLRSAKPDVVFVLSYTDPATKLVAALKQLDWYPSGLLAYGAGFVDPAFLKGVGDDAEGMMTRASWSADLASKRPAAKAVADLFRDLYNAPMTENSARSFTSALTLFQAIDKAGSTDPDKIRAALEAMSVPAEQTIMPWTGIKFDAKHQNSGAQGVVEQLTGGSYKVVFPADLASTSAVWPFRAAG